MGGMYNLINMHTYHYGGNNPVKYTDPTGMFDVDEESKKIIFYDSDFINNQRTKESGDAMINSDYKGYTLDGSNITTKEGKQRFNGMAGNFPSMVPPELSEQEKAFAQAGVIGISLICPPAGSALAGMSLLPASKEVIENPSLENTMGAIGAASGLLPNPYGAVLPSTFDIAGKGLVRDLPAKTEEMKTETSRGVGGLTNFVRDATIRKMGK